jgi:hypothetical protein
MSIFTIAFDKPTNLTTVSKYTVFNGFIYFGLGIALIVWPGAIQTLFRERAFIGDEQGLFRALGMAVAIIGYYLVVGGRAGSRQTAAASVIDRLTIVPLVLLPLAIAGVFPRFLITIVITDFCLAMSTWFLCVQKESLQPMDRLGARPDGRANPSAVAGRRRLWDRSGDTVFGEVKRPARSGPMSIRVRAPQAMSSVSCARVSGQLSKH